MSEMVECPFCGDKIDIEEYHLCKAERIFRGEILDFDEEE